MKIALVHDGIFCRAGGERVLLHFHQAFPDAPIFTGIYDPENSFPEFRNCKIITSCFQKVAKSEKYFKRLYFPLGIWAMERMDVTQYDVVLMTTTHCAKYVKVSPRSLVIAYCFTPFRLAWNPSSYQAYESSKGPIRWLFNMVVNRLRAIDFRHAQKVNQFIAMTKETRERLVHSYQPQKSIPVFNPAIDCSRYEVTDHVDDYYLVVSRLEKYKKVDLVIDAFNEIGLKLIIVGRGVERDRLRKLAKSNIEFKEGLSDHELKKLYQSCRAFIFPQHEDYGLTPLEAIASGRPVLAYGQGGVLETMIPYRKGDDQWTAVFFSKQTKKSLLEGLELMGKLKPNSQFIREHAEKFDQRKFIKNIRDYVRGIQS